jgi:hypothetical protein
MAAYNTPLARLRGLAEMVAGTGGYARFRGDECDALLTALDALARARAVVDAARAYRAAEMAYDVAIVHGSDDEAWRAGETQDAARTALDAAFAAVDDAGPATTEVDDAT